VLYDEHGGFDDHAFPPAAVVPDDSPSSSGFAFDRLGARVPAVVISPWIDRASVDHDEQDRPVVRDHTSVLATLEKCFGLAPLTARDRVALDVESLLGRTAPRLTEAEAPWALPRLPLAAVDRARLARCAIRKPLTDFQRNLLHLVAHTSLTRTTGTERAMATSPAGPTAKIAAPQLRHARGLAAPIRERRRTRRAVKTPRQRKRRR
jgi:phospholipase C